MKHSRLFIVILFVILTLDFATPVFSSSYFMTSNDGSCQNLTLSGISSAIISPQNGSRYSNNSNCDLLWNSTTGHRVLMKLIIDLPEAVNQFCSDRLEIFDSGNMTHPNVTFCGNTTTVFESSAESVKLMFFSESNSTHVGHGFTATVTSYTKNDVGNCSASEVLCDTHRCIPDSLQCDSIVNCVDGNDENVTVCHNGTAPSNTTNATLTTSSTLSGSVAPSTVANRITIGSVSFNIGDKTVMAIIIISAASLVTVVATVIIYHLWCKRKDDDIVTLVEEAPKSSRSNKIQPETAPKKEPTPKPEPEPGKKEPRRSKRVKTTKDDLW